MKKSLFVLIAFVLTAHAWAGQRVDFSDTMGLIQVAVPELTRPTTFTLSVTQVGVKTRTVTKYVDPAKRKSFFLSTLDSATSYTITMFDDAGTTLTTNSLIQTKNIEDYYFGIEKGAVWRAQMEAAAGAVVWNNKAKSELNETRKLDMLDRMRALLRDNAAALLAAQAAEAESKAAEILERAQRKGD